VAARGAPPNSCPFDLDFSDQGALYGHELRPRGGNDSPDEGEGGSAREVDDVTVVICTVAEEFDELHTAKHNTWVWMLCPNR